MDLKQLQTFVSVADARSFSRAAAQLGMAQSSLSKQIRMLEVELRHSLFVRNGRGVSPTEVGNCLLDHARAVLATVDRTRDALAEFRTVEHTGKVVVGLPPRVARFITVPLVEKFRLAFPNASLTICEGLSITICDWLSIGRVDLAVLFEPVQSADLDKEPVVWEELVLVGGSKAASTMPESVSFKQMRRYPLIMPRMPNTTRALVESAARRAGVELVIAAEVDTIQAILELVGRNNGFTIAPRGTLNMVSGKLVAVAKIHSPVIRSKAVLASSKSRPLTVLAQKTRDMLLELDLAKLLGQNDTSKL